MDFKLGRLSKLDVMHGRSRALLVAAVADRFEVPLFEVEKLQVEPESLVLKEVDEIYSQKRSKKAQAWHLEAV